MNMSRIISFISILSVMFLFSVSNAFAADLIQVKTNPITPGPDQDVTITLQSYAVNLNTAEIIWYLNGEASTQGVAEKSFTIHTGDLGVSTVVEVAIIPLYGEKINKKITIEPSEIDLLWEAKTYTPPFYKGKALPTFKSMVTVTAIPRKNSYTSNPASFYYKWTYNRIQGMGEAGGMNSVSVPAGWPDSAVPVAVDISLPGQEWRGSMTTNISATNPKVIFYEEQPLLGTRFEKSISNAPIFSGNIFTLRASPYFFSIDNMRNNDLVYTWQVNGQTSRGGVDPNIIDLQKAGKAEENFNVSLRIQNPKRILQEGRAASSVTLSKEE